MREKIPFAQNESGVNYPDGLTRNNITISRRRYLRAMQEQRKSVLGLDSIEILFGDPGTLCVEVSRNDKLFFFFFSDDDDSDHGGSDCL
jgi:hypothetical protein